MDNPHKNRSKVCGISLKSGVLEHDLFGFQRLLANDAQNSSKFTGPWDRGSVPHPKIYPHAPAKGKMILSLNKKIDEAKKNDYYLQGSLTSGHHVPRSTKNKIPILNDC